MLELMKWNVDLTLVCLWVDIDPFNLQLMLNLYPIVGLEYTGHVYHNTFVGVMSAERIHLRTR